MFIYTIGAGSAKLANEMYGFIIATGNWTEGLNFHVWNTVIATIKMSGNRLFGFVTNDSTPMLMEPCPQRSSSLPDIKHATFTAWNAVDEMGGGSHEMVLVLPSYCDVVCYNFPFRGFVLFSTIFIHDIFFLFYFKFRWHVLIIVPFIVIK
jgi:hypothetical protein